MGTITVSNLGKAYKQYPTRWSRLVEWLVPFSNPRHQLKWVLQDINFTVNPGEAVGIIGVNGAGKSTLLKILTGTTQFTRGSMNITGRVAALLELGMGFHPDFTGRQNAFMAGQLLGYNVEELAKLMPEIEEFADIRDYIDQPVRVYSSGMQVRLAFAVATAIRPEILIVDEALSVGDAAFQRKCFQRIERFMDQGTTLLFVSHDMETIKKICNKVIHISNGRLVRFGNAKEVCDQYEKLLFGKKAEIESKINNSESLVDVNLLSNCEVNYGDDRAYIEEIWLASESGQRSNVFTSQTDLNLYYRVRVKKLLQNPVFAMMIKTREGVAVFGTDSNHLGLLSGEIEPNNNLEVTFNFKNNLAPGTYYLNCGIRDDKSDDAVFIHRRVDALIFRVVPNAEATVVTGLVELSASISVK